MPVTVVVGGQFGGEGKGKVAHFLAKEMEAKVAVRVGGSNSGHTVIDPSGNALILRQLPTASILPNVTCVLGAGSYIDIDILFKEIDKTNLATERLYIDPNAVVITEKEKYIEKISSLRSTIGSTSSGTGAAVLKRISRDGLARFAKDEDRLKPFICPVVSFMRDILSQNERIIIEGTQGFGLSVLHTPYYPYATSRDTTAAAFISETGLSPMDVDEVVLVIRVFPIRVGGNSGPLPKETNWETVTTESGSLLPIVERTSVTNTIRRVAHFDVDIVHQAILVNQPTHIVLNHLDYLHRLNSRDCPESENIVKYVSNVASDIGKRIDYIGCGPDIMISRETAKGVVGL